MSAFSKAYSRSGVFKQGLQPPVMLTFSHIKIYATLVKKKLPIILRVVPLQNFQM